MEVVLFMRNIGRSAILLFVFLLNAYGKNLEVGLNYGLNLYKVQWKYKVGHTSYKIPKNSPEDKFLHKFSVYGQLVFPLKNKMSLVLCLKLAQNYFTTLFDYPDKVSFVDGSQIKISDIITETKSFSKSIGIALALNKKVRLLPNITLGISKYQHKHYTNYLEQETISLMKSSPKKWDVFGGIGVDTQFYLSKRIYFNFGLALETRRKVEFKNIQPKTSVLEKLALSSIIIERSNQHLGIDLAKSINVGVGIKI